MKTSTLMTAGAVALIAGGIHAGTIWVDASNYGKANLDGSEANAYGTIQDAVNAAATSGDTIYVRPGVYDKGYGVDEYGTTNRVCVIDKNVRIEATGSKDETHIVGWKDPNGEHGMSTAAIRCVFVKSETGSIIKGFTVRDGATAFKTAGGSFSDTNPYRGGGFNFYWRDAKNHNYIVDCVVSNCAAAYGGAMLGGMAIRSLFTDNFAWQSGAVQRGGFAWNCVMTRNYGDRGDTRTTSLGNIAHCTILCNAVGGVLGASGVNCAVYNSIIIGNKSGDDHNLCTMAGNAFTANGVMQVGSVIDDFRVLTGSYAATCADATYQTLPSESFDEIPSEFAGKDFYGNSFPPPGGGLCAGAVQQTFTPAYGAVYVPTPASSSATFSVDGIDCPQFYYAFAKTYPEQHHLKITPASGRVLSYVTQACGTLVPSFRQMPNGEGELSVIPPPNAGAVLTNTVIATAYSNVLWVDDDNYGLAGLDGSDTKAYGTIQDAVNAASANALIKVRPGTYNKGGAVSAGVTNRVVCSSAKAPLFIESTDGADKTFIVGAADPTTGGVGSGAVRCVSFAGMHKLSGFTLTGSFGGASGEGAQGAAFRAGDTSACIVDCVVSNVVSADSIVQCGTMTRCRIMENKAPVIAWKTDFNACLVTGNRPRSGTSCTVMSQCNAHHSTIAGNTASTTINSTTAVRNSVVAASGSHAASGTSVHSLLWNFTSYGSVSGTYVSEDPMFAAGDEMRPLSYSPAYSKGADLTAASPASAWMYASLDLDGNPIRLNNGRISMGAYSTPSSASVVYVDVTDGDLAIIGGGTGYNDISSGGEMSFSPGNASRPIAGIVVNGETNLFASTEGATVSISTAQASGGVLVKAIYTTDWYVDDNGAVGNSGFAPNHAKNSFQALFDTGKVVSGDTVHVLPGTYNTGSMSISGSSIAARLVVPSGVTVVSTDGAEKTIIVGKSADTEEAYSSYDKCGCGIGAMHAVKLEAHAKLIGFTVTGGRTRANTSDHYSNDYKGGGILGSGRQDVDNPTSYAAECIISNNAAFRGGGARDVTLVNCRLYDNKAYYGGSGISDGSLVGCVVDGNTDFVSQRSVFQYGRVVNCTVMDLVTDPLSANSRVLNTYMHSWREQTNGETGNLVICSNCVYRAESNPTAAKINESCAIAPESNLVFENGRPVAGANACIDFADPGYLYAIASGKDASLGARVTNGRLDVGAFEANWLPRYSSDIGRRFSVTAATSGVVESKTTGKVEIGDGESIEGFLANPSGKTDSCRIKFTVCEGASAVITVNGVETTYSSAGVHEHCFSGAAEGDVVLIAAVGGTVVVDSAGRGGFVLIYR